MAKIVVLGFGENSSCIHSTQVSVLMSYFALVGQQPIKSGQKTHKQIKDDYKDGIDSINSLFHQELFAFRIITSNILDFELL